MTLSFSEQYRKEELATMNMKELEMQLALVEAAMDRLNYGRSITEKANKVFDINELNV